LFGALVVAAIFGALACLAWWHKEFTARYVVLVVIFLGLRAVWRLLPLSEGTRAFWKNEKRLSKKHLFASYLFPVYMTAGSLVSRLWEFHPQWPNWNGLGVFLVYEILMVAVVIGCRRHLRQKEPGAV